jgi:hypothetical protein
MENYKPILDQVSGQTGVVFRPASPDDLSKLGQFGLPDSIIKFYQKFEPDSCAELQVRLWPIEHILEENNSLSPGFYVSKYGYVVFATNYCGDTFCFNLKSREEPSIVFISHEKICGETTLEEIVKYAVPVANSFLEFLSQFARQEIPKKFT